MKVNRLKAPLTLFTNMLTPNHKIVNHIFVYLPQIFKKNLNKRLDKGVKVVYYECKLVCSNLI